MEPVREYLKQNRLLFDGGMGTYYLSRYPGSDPRCELQNLENPARILEIHREYREAGAKALKTNTFGANTVSLECGFNKVREVLEAGYALACRAAGEEAYVFADIGPSAEPEERRAIAEVFLAMGAKNFLFETYADSEGLAELCRFVKFREPEAFVIVSFAAAPDGFTRHGLPVSRLLQEMAAEDATDAVGVNCVSGPAHLLRLLGEIPVLPKLLSVMPNSGYPTMVAGRTYFESSATYFAGCMARIAEKGAAILGGCCGSISSSRLSLAANMELSARTLATGQSAMVMASTPSILSRAALSRKKLPSASTGGSNSTATTRFPSRSFCSSMPRFSAGPGAAATVSIRGRTAAPACGKTLAVSAI